jgi:hypothetical protein
MMIKCSAFLVTLLCAPLSLPSPAAAQPWTQEKAVPKIVTPDKAILDLICEPGKIRMRECLKAKGYPEGRDCNVRLTRERIEGRFLDGDTVYLLAFYTSRCEPHAHRFGGGLILEKHGETLLFHGYQPGLIAGGCITSARGGDRDRLVCIGSWMDQGYETELLGEVVFKKAQGGAVEASFEELLSAVRSEGARGADTVECDKEAAYFGFADVTRGPTPETIAFNAVYADKPLIDRLCDRLEQNVRPGFAPLMENEAYIAPGEAKTGRFVYDLVKKAIAPLETAPMR